MAQIQVIGPNDVVPEGVKKWCQNSDLEPSHSAVVEFLTARTAKFVVGVLRKRLAQLNFRFVISGQPAFSLGKIYMGNFIQGNLYREFYIGNFI